MSAPHSSWAWEKIQPSQPWHCSGCRFSSSSLESSLFLKSSFLQTHHRFWCLRVNNGCGTGRYGPNLLLPSGTELGFSAPSNPKNCVWASLGKPHIATHLERAQSDRARGKGETRAGPKGTIPPRFFRAKGNHPPRLGTVVGNIHCSRAPLASCPSFSSWKLCQSPTPSFVPAAGVSGHGKQR